MSKRKPFDHAKPVIHQSTETDAERVNVTRALATNMQSSPEWNAAPLVQAATAMWTQAAEAVATNAQLMRDLEAQLAAAAADQRARRRNWAAATQHVLATVAVHAQGSKDRVRAFGLGVRTPASAPALAAPEELTAIAGKESGELVVAWKRGNARYGFHVQHATALDDPLKVSAALPCTRAKLVLRGLEPHATVFFRVAAIDPSAPMGLTTWSEWAAGTAR